MGRMVGAMEDEDLVKLGMRSVYTFSVVLVGLTALMLPGCSGGGKLAPLTTVQNTSRGSAQFTIVWPQPTGRLIPEAAKSIKIALAGPTPTTKTVARPPVGTSTTTVSFPDLATGDYTATATAYPTDTATGIAQATGAVSLAITKNQTTSTSLTMDSTITKVELGVSGSLSVDMGATRTLTAVARNARNEVVLVADAQWEWSASNTNFELTPNGPTATVKAKTLGTTTVSVKDKESGRSVSVTLTAVLVTFEGLGDLAGGAVESRAFAVSADGSVVVGSSISGNVTGPNKGEAFRWTAATGMVGLGDIPGGNFTSWGYGVSADGSVVVGSGYDSTGTVPFRWTQATGMVSLGLDTGWTKGWAWSVSGDGATISGTLATTTSSEAFRWTQASGFTRLGDFSGGEFRSEGRGISADGTTIVGTGTTGYDIPCRSVAGAAFTTLDIPGTSGSAWATTPDGNVIVGYRDIPGQEGRQAFRWTQAGGAVFLGDFPGGGLNGWPASYAMGISADGKVVVGSGMSTEGSRVFVWTSAGGLQDLGDILRAHGINLGAWAELTNATDHAAEISASISADGTTIVGIALHNGSREAFRAYKSDGFLNP